MLFGSNEKDRNSQVSCAATTTGLINGFNRYEYDPDDAGSSLASDASGRLYVVNFDGSVRIVIPPALNAANFVQLPVSAAGIAIDNVRGRIYFSNESGNSISVYSTAGKFLHTMNSGAFESLADVSLASPPDLFRENLVL